MITASFTGAVAGFGVDSEVNNVTVLSDQALLVAWSTRWYAPELRVMASELAPTVARKALMAVINPA